MRRFMLILVMLWLAGCRTFEIGFVQTPTPDRSGTAPTSTLALPATATPEPPTVESSPTATATAMITPAATRRPVARPSLDELIERAYAIVAIASPPRPFRRRVEWLVGGYGHAALAIDILVEGGYLVEVEDEGGDARLTLGHLRLPVLLLGEN